MDRDFAELARTIPGFAGFHFDEDGTPVVHLVDLGLSQLARDALTSILSARTAATGDMRFVQAEYGFLQLAAWRSYFPSILSIHGVVSAGIGERANRLQVSVESDKVGKAVLAELTSFGVPAGAVVVSVVPPATFYSTLSSYTRPLVGGLSIEFQNAGGTNSACTLGFSAYTEGEPDIKFLTNSHCTETRGQVEFTNYYQPTRTSDAYQIGVEVQDPVYGTGGPCPAGQSCRFSDASVATYANCCGYDASADLGKIARTVDRSTGISGSTTIDSSNPRINITWSFGHPYVGETLDKVGARTGWTTGEVFETCSDINVGSITLWCQEKVAAGAWHGDSGSPVFYYNAPSNATLVGILWGGPGQSINDQVFYMSSMDGIGGDGILIDRVY